MENQITALLELCKEIDPKDFYVITVYEEEITFQGTYNLLKLRKYKKKGFVFNNNIDAGMLIAQKDGVDITLTK